MPRELQAHLDQNTEATLALAAAVRSDRRWKRAVVAVVLAATVLILWGQSLGRDVGESIADCVPPPPGHEPGECYARSVKNQGKAIADIRQAQRDDLEHAVNVFIVDQGGKPVDIEWPSVEGSP